MLKTEKMTKDYALYPIQEIKQLYKIKAEYEILRLQLERLLQENKVLKQKYLEKKIIA